MFTLRLTFYSAILFIASCLLPAQTVDLRARIADLFQGAQRAEHSEDYSAAADAYRAIVKLDPRIAEVWSNLGMALFHLGAGEAAIDAFRKASLLKPGLIAPHVFQGLAYLDLRAPLEAIAPFKAALALDPDQLEATLGLSDAYAQTQQFEAAIHLLKGVLRKLPDSEEAGSRLASTYLEWAQSIGLRLRHSSTIHGKLLMDESELVEQPELAEGALRKTIASAPESVEAHIALARFFIEVQPTSEHLQAAEEQLVEARTLAPNNLDAASATVRLAIARSDTPGAIDALRSILAMDPAYMLANSDALFASMPAAVASDFDEQARRAVTQARASPRAYSGSVTSELEMLERVRSSRKLTVDESARYGADAWHLHRYDEAFAVLAAQPHPGAAGQYWLYRTCEALGGKMLEQTVAAHPDSGRSHLLLANLALQRNDFQNARTEYSAAVALSPHDPQVRILYIRFLVTARDIALAVTQVKTAVAEFPINAELNYLAGELTLRSGGDASLAAGYLEQSLKTDAKLVSARIDLADAYAQLHRPEDAIREISLVLDNDTDGSLHYRLSRWYKETGHPAESARALEVTQRMKAAKSQQFVPPS